MIKQKVLGAILAFMTALALPLPAFAAGLNGAELSIGWVLPFAGILLCIAVCPLAVPHFWHSNYGKVAVFWALATAVPLFAIYGGGVAVGSVAHALIGDYVPFIIFVGSLYTVAGGIHIRSSFTGTPLTNTGFLALGAVLANIMGTTGAAMLLIRPLIAANERRRYVMHTFVFFIFIVANIAGSLTPLGDPPLFLGFLRGVEFFWTTEHLIAPMLTAVGLLLAIYYIADTVLYNKEKDEFLLAESTRTKESFGVEGKINFLLLGVIIAAVLMAGVWDSGVEFTLLGVHLTGQGVLRDLIFLVAAGASLALTPDAIRKANQFSWEPVLEVGKLFFGIFVTIVPVLEMLKAGAAGAFAPVVALVTNPDGTANNAMYFWMTGALSGFLDNAPTYLAFFNMAGGDAAMLMTEGAVTLTAISMGAVFMGANSYIGNAPNFMVVAIVQNRGLKMPAFFAYLLWSVGILIPIFLLLTWLYLM